MRDLEPQPTLEDVGTYEKAPTGFGLCDDEFVGILTQATEQGSKMDILMELLEDLVSYEQRYEWDPGEFLRQVTGSDEDVLDGDFLSWSRTYYRFIALANLVQEP